MKRHAGLLALAALTLVSWVCLPSTAQAWGHRGWGWGYGGWGWGYGGYGGWGGWGGWGGYRGWGYPAWGYSRCGYSGWGYAGLRGYGYGYGGYPWYASYYATPYYSAVLPYYARTTYVAPITVTAGPIVSTPASATVARSTPTTRPNRATIRVHVPADAQVSFDGTAMHQGGTDRVYVTPPLQSGVQDYTFDVTARWKADGKDHRESRHILVSAGRTTEVNFLTTQNVSRPADSHTVAATASQTRRSGANGQ